MNDRIDLERPGAAPTGTRARERMLTGTSLTERRMKVTGVSTCVLEGGQGSPLLLLHGGIECGGAVWAPVISRLAERHRLIVPDLPGLGESEPVARLDQAAFIDWLAELLRQAVTEKPTLVAHSLSASLAARFAAVESGLLHRLVICSAPGIGAYRMPVRLRIVAIRFALRPSERNAERFDRFALLDLDQTRKRDPEWFDAFTAYTVSRAAVSHVKRTMHGLVKTGTKRVPDAELRSIGIPVDLIWGRHDRMVSLDLAKEASARLGWPLRVIDDAAHAPQIERPDAFVQALTEVTRDGSSPPGA